MDSYAQPWEDAGNIAHKAFDLYNDDKHAEALSELEKAIKIAPWDSSLFFNKGLILDSMCNFDDAVTAFEQALDLELDDPEILNSLGIDYTRTGMYDLALDTFEKLQKISPDFEPGYCNRIFTYTEMGQHDKAEIMFHLAQQITDTCPLCYYNIGISFFKRGNYDQAIRCLEKTKYLEPTHPQIDHSIGQAYWASGEKEKAKKYFIAEMKKEKEDNVLLNYSLLLLEMGELEEAEGLLRFILELEPNNKAADHYLGGLHFHKVNISNITIEQEAPPLCVRKPEWRT